MTLSEALPYRDTGIPSGRIIDSEKWLDFGYIKKVEDLLIDWIWGLRKPKESTRRIELPFIEMGKTVGERVFWKRFSFECVWFKMPVDIHEEISSRLLGILQPRMWVFYNLACRR